MTIEMLAHKLNEPKFMAPLLDKPDLERDWSTISEAVDTNLSTKQDHI